MADDRKGIMQQITDGVRKNIRQVNPAYSGDEEQIILARSHPKIYDSVRSQIGAGFNPQWKSNEVNKAVISSIIRTGQGQRINLDALILPKRKLINYNFNSRLFNFVPALGCNQMYHSVGAMPWVTTGVYTAIWKYRMMNMQQLGPFMNDQISPNNNEKMASVERLDLSDEESASEFTRNNNLSAEESDSECESLITVIEQFCRENM